MRGMVYSRIMHMKKKLRLSTCLPLARRYFGGLA